MVHKQVFIFWYFLITYEFNIYFGTFQNVYKPGLHILILPGQLCSWHIFWNIPKCFSGHLILHQALIIIFSCVFLFVRLSIRLSVRPFVCLFVRTSKLIGQSKKPHRTFLCIHIYTCVHKCLCTCWHLYYSHVYSCLNMFTQMLTHMFTQMFTHMLTQMLTQMYANMFTHTTGS